MIDILCYIDESNGFKDILNIIYSNNYAKKSNEQIYDWVWQ